MGMNRLSKLQRPHVGERFAQKQTPTRPETFQIPRNEFTTAKAITMLLGMIAGGIFGAMLGIQTNLMGAFVGGLLGAAAGLTLGISIWH